LISKGGQQGVRRYTCSHYFARKRRIDFEGVDQNIESKLKKILKEKALVRKKKIWTKGEGKKSPGTPGGTKQKKCTSHASASGEEKRKISRARAGKEEGWGTLIRTKKINERGKLGGAGAGELQNRNSLEPRKHSTNKKTETAMWVRRCEVRSKGSITSNEG